MKIFSGNSNPDLAKEICNSINVPLGEADVTPFPDGETFVQIKDNVRGCDVFVIQPTSNPANNNLMELLIMIDALKRASAKRITAVIPFFGYARQDRKDRPRVPITGKLVANLLVAAGANRVLALDLHAQQIQGFFDIPVDHLYASSVFYEYIKNKPFLKDATVFSPDVGGMKAASAFANLLDLPLGFVAKRRVSATTVQSTSLVGEVEGKNIILIDDMTETAGTLCSAAKLLRENGAKSVRACVSHCMLNEIAYERLGSGVIDEIITTKSVPVDSRGLPITVLSVATLIGEAIRRIHENNSVSGLFKIKGY